MIKPHQGDLAPALAEVFYLFNEIAALRGMDSEREILLSLILVGAQTTAGREISEDELSGARSICDQTIAEDTRTAIAMPEEYERRKQECRRLKR